MRLEAILKKLVSIDTSIENSTLEAVFFIKKIFDEQNLETHIIPYENDRNRACFIASTGNLKSPGLLLSGHLDTYGVYSQLKNWKTNPFELHIEDNIAIGRGVVDMKGAISAFLSVIDKLKNIQIPVHLVLTHDEEGRFYGIRQLLNHKFYDLICPKQHGCIIMEPTSFNPIFYHQGYERQIVEFRSIDSKKIDIEICDFLKSRIEQTYQKTRCKENYNLQNNEFILNMGNVIFIDDRNAKLDYQIKYSSENEIVANNFVRRINLEVQKYNYKFPSLIIQTRQKNKVCPFNAKKDGNFYKLVKNYFPCEDNILMNFGTEAGFFQKFGVENIMILGPGEYDRAHRSNENVNLNELKKYSKFLYDISNDMLKENSNVINCFNLQKKTPIGFIVSEIY